MSFPDSSSSPVSTAPGERRNTGRSRRIIAVAALGGLLAFFAALWFSTPAVDDPVHQGRHLSEYLAQLPATYTAGDGGYTSFPVNARDINRMTAAEVEAYHAGLDQRREVAEAAVRALGPQCFPFLLRQVRKTETLPERLVQRAARGLGRRIFPSRTYARRWQAVTALRVLKRSGSDIKPLLPVVRELARDADPDIRLAARLLLGQWDRSADTTMGQSEAPVARPK